MAGILTYGKLSLLVLVAAMLSQPSLARTAAMDSLADASAAVTAMLDPNVLRTPLESYLEECNSGIENYRIHTAAIFGENELDDSPYKTQCESSLGYEAPPTGRILAVSNGKILEGCSGDLVFKNDIVVTAAHCFSGDNGEPYPIESMFFEIYEKNSRGECVRNTYDLESRHLGNEGPSSRESGNDFAVIKLKEPVLSYAPLRLPPQNFMPTLRDELLKNPTEKFLVSGFGFHESIQQGKDLAIVAGSTFDLASNSPYRDSINTFAHDADTVPGMSGAAITIVQRAKPNEVIHVADTVVPKRYDRYFIGIHIGGTKGEHARMDVHEAFNLGIFMDEDMRAVIENVAGARPVLKADRAN